MHRNVCTTILVVACVALFAKPTIGAIENLRVGCTAFVPAQGLSTSDPTELLCGDAWLVQYLQIVNSTAFQSYLNRTNGNLQRVMDLACPLPGGCSNCITSMANFYNYITNPCQPVTSNLTSELKDVAYNVGRSCRTTNNPFQVFHPLASVSTNCFLCTRAFLVQLACTNTQCNQRYGLDWFPMYPLPPNGNWQSQLASVQEEISSQNSDSGAQVPPAGVVAATWSTNIVCRCFELINRKDLLVPLTATQLNQLGYCLWVIYQGDPAFVRTLNTVALTA